MKTEDANNEVTSKTILITGATSGIGKEVAKRLLSKGHHILVVGSSPDKINRLVNELVSINSYGKSQGFYADLSRQSEVNRLSLEVDEYLNRTGNGSLDVLINNAGAVRNRYCMTEDKIEYQWAVNQMAGFLLSVNLLKNLRNGIILFTGSYSHQKAFIHWQNIGFKHRYFIYSVYRQSKLANVMTAKAFNEKLLPLSIHSYVVDPGLVNTDIANKHTSKLVQWVWSNRRKRGTDPSVPALTYEMLIEQHPKDGLVFKNKQPISYNRRADQPKQYQRLCQICEQLCHRNIDTILQQLID